MQDPSEIAEANRRSVIRQNINHFRQRLVFRERLTSVLIPLLVSSSSLLTFACATSGNIGCAAMIGVGTVLVTLRSVVRALRRSAEGRDALQQMEAELNQPVEQFVQENPLATLRIRARQTARPAVSQDTIVLLLPDGSFMLGIEEGSELHRHSQTGAGRADRNIPPANEAL